MTKQVTGPKPRNVLDRFWEKVDVRSPDECWNWKGRKNEFGYGLFDLMQIPKRAHRVIWELLNGPISEGKQVLHKCDNKSCVNPDHLYLGTHTDNVMDILDRNLPVGQPPKLYNEEVWLIRKTYKSGRFRQDLIAKMFKISQGTVSSAILGKLGTKGSHNVRKDAKCL